MLTSAVLVLGIVPTSFPWTLYVAFLSRYNLQSFVFNHRLVAGSIPGKIAKTY